MLPGHGSFLDRGQRSVDPRHRSEFLRRTRGAIQCPQSLIDGVGRLSRSGLEFHVSLDALPAWNGKRLGVPATARGVVAG
jgi:hypothetical protein